MSREKSHKEWYYIAIVIVLCICALATIFLRGQYIEETNC
jgi:hypothetical protein